MSTGPGANAETRTETAAKRSDVSVPERTEVALDAVRRELADLRREVAALRREQELQELDAMVVDSVLGYIGAWTGALCPECGQTIDPVHSPVTHVARRLPGGPPAHAPRCPVTETRVQQLLRPVDGRHSR